MPQDLQCLRRKKMEPREKPVLAQDPERTGQSITSTVFERKRSSRKHQKLVGDDDETRATTSSKASQAAGQVNSSGQSATSGSNVVHSHKTATASAATSESKGIPPRRRRPRPKASREAEKPASAAQKQPSTHKEAADQKSSILDAQKESNVILPATKSESMSKQSRRRKFRQRKPKETHEGTVPRTAPMKPENNIQDTKSSNTPQEGVGSHILVSQPWDERRQCHITRTKTRTASPPRYQRLRKMEPRLSSDADMIPPDKRTDTLRRHRSLRNDNDARDHVTAGVSQVPCTAIEESAEYLHRLQSLVAEEKILRTNGYITEPLTPAKLERKIKCQRCGKSLWKSFSKERLKAVVQGVHEDCDDDIEVVQLDETKFLPPGEEQGGKDPNNPEREQQDPIRCKFHNGRVLNRRWTCCGRFIFSEPCSGAKEHIPLKYSPGELERLWAFHRTPMERPFDEKTSEIRRAVAIDCEMGTAVSGDSELIRLTVIDYFTSATLIDSLVYPDVPIRDYRTPFSGITRRDMEFARRRGTCIMGRDNARRAIWKYVGPDTIVVGHSVNNDLESLRWIHTVVVDTLLIEASLRAEEEKKISAKKKAGAPEEPESSQPTTEHLPERAAATICTKEVEQPEKPKKSHPLALKTLAVTRLGRHIQTKMQRGHDSLEDALAARDLAHWHVLSREALST
ncbi:hypothetical protein VTO42DRAFT_8892 [Malbranchea cinnamomea]